MAIHQIDRPSKLDKLGTKHVGWINWIEPSTLVDKATSFERNVGKKGRLGTNHADQVNH